VRWPAVRRARTRRRCAHLAPFLESLREGRIGDARIQSEALHDVTLREARFTFNGSGELEAEAEAEPEAEI
jgi:hypothetical protein